MAVARTPSSPTLTHDLARDRELPLRVWVARPFEAFLEAFFADFFFDFLLGLGTLAPSRRASDKPIAIACLRLVTFLPERPERRVPRLRSRMLLATLLLAFLL